MNQPASSPEITLYEADHSRAARCRWALRELGLQYTSISSPTLFHSDELKKVHPLGKLPAALINGQSLFESAAICTYLADLAPEKGLLSPAGTYLRALHDQWVSFCLTEMEAYLWSNARNSMDMILPKEQQVHEIIEQNTGMFLGAAAVLEKVLGRAHYLVDNHFSMTDIIVGFTISWGAMGGLLKELPNLQAYLQRLRERPHCTLGGT